MRTLLTVLILAASCGTAPLPAQVTTTLTLTPGANAIQVSSSLSTSQAAPQVSGSDVTQWTGTITVQFDNAFAPTSMTILSANLVAQDSGTYAPYPSPISGSLGGAPANYAFDYPSPFAHLYVALREEQMALASTSLALAGAMGAYTFAPSGTNMAFTHGFADHRRPLPENTYREPLPTQFFADASTSQGALTFNGSAVAIRLPLDLTFSVTLHDPGSGIDRGTPTFRFVGTLNATGVIPEPSTWALTLGGAGLLSLAARRRR